MTFLKTKSLLPVSLYLSNITVSDMGSAFAGIHSDHGAFDIFICLWAELFRAGDSCIRIKGVEA